MARFEHHVGKWLKYDRFGSNSSQPTLGSPLNLGDPWRPLVTCLIMVILAIFKITDKINHRRDTRHVLFPTVRFPGARQEGGCENGWFQDSNPCKYSILWLQKELLGYDCLLQEGLFLLNPGAQSLWIRKVQIPGGKGRQSYWVRWWEFWADSGSLRLLPEQTYHCPFPLILHCF